jgi:hypothetical protein
MPLKVRLYLIVFFLILSGFNEILLSSVLKVTGERWYEWNGTSWIWDRWDDYDLSDSAYVNCMNRYYYNSTGSLSSTQLFSRTNITDGYKLRYYKSWVVYHSWAYYECIYTYDLYDKLISSYSSSVSSDDYTDERTISYTYGENDRLIRTEQSVIASYPYTNIDTVTDYFYDEYGRITLEATKIVDNKELKNYKRTVWTYDGNIGSGVTEIYKNTVWIFFEEKIRTLDESYKSKTEERHNWSWGNWINNEKDYLYYSESPAKSETTEKYLIETLTFKYDHLLNVYNPYLRHNIFYENFYLEPLSPPSNISSSIAGTVLTLTWDAVPDATGYLIYSSNGPDGIFYIDTSGEFSGTTWTTTLSDQKKFYKITSTREDK